MKCWLTFTDFIETGLLAVLFYILVQSIILTILFYFSFLFILNLFTEFRIKVKAKRELRKEYYMEKMKRKDDFWKK